ncbi:General amino-acid permease GAP1 [Cyphellophora attinorum]|uniref:General amino-acid permease GAP1 n=1 Tax=Cyphellophora attinorum TaxID=1664694 RepID=A0A0N1P043_9EURO|nr:General amino-acid permease GAP1 [Phialophora attinorum]KPI39623.1 General amino-acid permease GAP1 [Phialophora attinorum]
MSASAPSANSLPVRTQRSVSILSPTDAKQWTPQSSSSSSHSPTSGSLHPSEQPTSSGISNMKNLRTRVVDSFRRDPTASLTRNTSVGHSTHNGDSRRGSRKGSGESGGDKGDGGDEESGPMHLPKAYDVEQATEATAASPLLRQLKGRHLQMIAIGGSIGTGLFVGSGKALAHGGPASLVIAFSLIGIMMYCTMQALGEMAVLFPVAGSFSAYSSRFLDPAWGFAMGWNYAMQWLVVFPLELVAASITVDYWVHSTSLNAAWITIFWSLIVTINFFGVKGYGEAEFVFSIVKVTAVIGYIILGVIMNIGGGPEGSYIGFSVWDRDGAFKNGFKGLCSVFVTAAFAFAGTELVGLAAAETENPRKALPTAIKQVFWRITLFYIVSLFLVGTLVSSNDPRLLSASSSADATASPFVISIENSLIAGLPGVMNCVIMIAVLSVGNSAVYGSSRTLAALAEQRQAPHIFAYIDRKGRPIVSILLASCLGWLGYFASSRFQQTAFDWMLAISGLSSIFTWGSICAAHIRFRAAWKVQGHTLDELAFISPIGVAGSYVGLITNILILIAQFWTGFAPVDYEEKSTSERIEGFFQDYLAAPVVVVCYIGYKVVYRTKVLSVRDINLYTGKREMNVRGLLAEERVERRGWPRWKRMYKFFC